MPRDGGVYLTAYAQAPQHRDMPAFSSEHLNRLLPGNGLLALDIFAPDAARSVQPAVPLEHPSEEGLTLLGYDWTDDLLTTYWRVDSLDPAAAILVLSALCADEQAVARRVTVQGEMVPGTEWRTGDVHVHQMTLPLDARDVQVGQYDVVAQRNMIFLPDYTPLVELRGQQWSVGL